MQSLMERVMQGGIWIATIRGWIQRKKWNGSRVTWGSTEPLDPPMTCGELEEVVALAIEADRQRILKGFDEAESVVGSMMALRERIRQG